MPSASSEANPAAGAPLVEPLTRREREILGLLAQGQSAPEIAKSLVLAVSSVKWHQQQLYGKLGVNSKQAALQRAAELGLLAAPGADAAPTPASPHNLPHQLTNFIGRGPQIAAIRQRLQTNRLATLTGPGGAGKTRLAQQIGAEALPDFPDGVWLVLLAPLADSAQVVRVVASAVQRPAETTEKDTASDELASLVASLGDRRLLIILDNCEHLVEACAHLAEQLLVATPGVRILATSREALGVTGEVSYPVPALTMPAPDQADRPDMLAQSEAVQLFVERAAAVRPDFALTPANARAVAQICNSLEGLPLALELAAARARTLSVEQIAANLDNRLRLLAGGSRTAPLRQQTVRGAIDWSYDLLAEPERALLRRAAIFAGGWALEAAAGVTALPDALDLLDQLVAKSLVVSEQPPGQPARFRMLATIQEYAHEKLIEAGELDTVRAQHLAYFLALAEEAEPKLRGPEQGVWLKRLDRERDNFQAAFAWAIQSQDSDRALRLAGVMGRYWLMRSDSFLAHRLGLTNALALRRTQPASLASKGWLAKALLATARIEIRLEEQNSASTIRERLDQALRLYRELGDQPGAALTLCSLAGFRVVFAKDISGGLDLFEQALAILESAHDDWGQGYCLHWMGHAAERSGAPARALDCYARSVEKFRAVGDKWELSFPLGDLVRAGWADDDPVLRQRLVDERLEALMALDDPVHLIGVRSGQSWLAAAQGDYARAREIALSIPRTPRGQLDGTTLARLGEIEYLQGHAAEANALFEASRQAFQPDLHGAAWPLAWQGILAYRAGQLDLAARLLAQSREYLGPFGWWDYNLALVLLGQADLARLQREFERAADLYGQSLRLVVKVSSQLEVPDRLEGLAKLALVTAQPERAVRLLAASAAMRAQLTVPVPAVEQADYDQALAAAKTQLDPVALAAAWAEGSALSHAQAVSFALEAAPAQPAAGRAGSQ